MKNDALFVRLDSFMDRCRDALDFTRTVIQFSKLERVEIGGTKGKVPWLNKRHIAASIAIKGSMGCISAGTTIVCGVCGK
jgi:uncharacterized glyoxalase superfamily protein PhnB